MNCNAAQNAVSLPATEQFGAMTWLSPFARMQTLWHDYQERTKRLRAMAVFAQIDAHTLRDIGAPNWVIAESHLRGDSRELRLLDLYRS